MEKAVTQRIIRRYADRLLSSLSVDVAIVGAGPSGLVCAYDLAKAGKTVALFERKVSPGGGVWGGGMLFTELVVQAEVAPMLDEFGIRHSAPEEGLVTADSVETASALVYRAVNTGARLFVGMTVEDVVFQRDRVAGVVVNWSAVLDEGLHVDPLVVGAAFVVDATGHDAGLTQKVARKAGIELNTETGGVMGEKPMWAEEGEKATVENSGEVYPGLFVSGMAANGVHGGFRMGPIFGGMFRSGRKVAGQILERLD